MVTGPPAELAAVPAAPAPAPAPAPALAPEVVAALVPEVLGPTGPVCPEVPEGPCWPFEDCVRPAWVCGLHPQQRVPGRVLAGPFEQVAFAEE